ncbi:hypothetical protein SAMN05660649_04215 [Desulfotomaculum arcticum]|uniref:DUF4352 domain-containing protein n=1 Tax=Desulfotruncus arcticus DSM 17038 TaxID=1121424 RepID=A0A1I2XZM1_9FIRM|nr:hypothetical protein [Desulfotruncus arcticus]SFH18958.1 hypothetical protein SAMN05660649_04215 [Desulfotomaculum arcticum] [Desulfotruncus arcticus DSM 17038]
MIKTYAKGLKSIEYISDESKGIFKSNEDNTHLRFYCSIKLKNHGHEKLVFYIKYIPSEHIKKEFACGEYAVAIDSNGKPKEFVLSPNSETVVNAMFEMKQKQGIYNGCGTIKNFSIELFNDNQIKVFKYKYD